MIRRAESRDDLATCVEICNAVQPDDPVTVDHLSHTGTFLLSDRDGYAYVDRSSVPGSVYAMVRVRPGVRRRGIGSALLVAARAAARELECGELWGRVRDDDSLAFVTRRGFHEVTRDLVGLRELEPGDGEWAPGIVELADEHLRGAYDVFVECMPEIALPQRAAARPYPEWLARERDAEVRALSLVALDGGDVVGYAALNHTGLPHRLEHGLTAVRHDHRRRGLATALKRAQIAWAAEHGYRELLTDMVEGNTGIRAVNERLGYRPLPPAIIVSGRALSV